LEKFHYKAKTSRGRPVTGIVEAQDKKSAARVLQGKKLVVISLSQIGEGTWYKLKSLFTRISSKDIVNFTRQLSTMISSGLSLSSSLAILQEQSNPAMGKVIAEVLEDVQAGSSLEQAFAKHKKAFPDVYVALVKAGEEAGFLGKVLERLAANLEKQENFKGKVKGAMIYPAIIVVAMIIVGIIMVVFVIPKVMDMYEEFEVDLPAMTKILMGIFTFISRFWFLGLVGLLLGFYGVYMWRKTPSGKEWFDRAILKIPIIGVLQQKMILTEMTRTLSLLSSAGVSIVESLDMIADGVGNALFERAFRRAAEEVEKGSALAQSLSGYDFIPPVVVHMVSVGEETGKIDEAMSKVSNYFEQEAERLIEALTTAVEPVMMILLGVGVGFLVISIILPIYNLTTQF